MCKPALRQSTRYYQCPFLIKGICKSWRRPRHLHRSACALCPSTPYFSDDMLSVSDDEMDDEMCEKDEQEIEIEDGDVEIKSEDEDVEIEDEDGDVEIEGEEIESEDGDVESDKPVNTPPITVTIEMPETLNSATLLLIAQLVNLSLDMKMSVESNRITLKCYNK